MDWSAAIAEHISRLRPLAIVNENEKGVHLRGGRWKRNLEPGWYLCWPIFDLVQTLDVMPQVVDLPNQFVTTQDGKTYAVSGAVEYLIEDVKKVLLEVQNFDKSLLTLAQVCVAQYVRDKASPIDLHELESEVHNKIEGKAREWGIEILDFGINEFGLCRAFRLMGHEKPKDL